MTNVDPDVRKLTHEVRRALARRDRPNRVRPIPVQKIAKRPLPDCFAIPALIDGPTFHFLLREGRRRGCGPAELAGLILTTVASENLILAVLDDAR